LDRRAARKASSGPGALSERARRIAELRDLVFRLGDFTDAAANRYPSPRPPVAEVPEPGPARRGPADLGRAEGAGDSRRG